MKQDRGMMKWMPYKSLVDQQTVLERMRAARAKIEKPKLSEEAAEEIDRALREYAGDPVRIRFFQDGAIYEIEGRISKINADFRYLVVEEEKILLSSLLRILPIEKDPK